MLFKIFVCYYEQCLWYLYYLQNAYIEHREVKAAQGVKIAAKELEKAIAGLNLYVTNRSDEVDLLKEEVSRELKSALSNIKLADRGVYVQASTLGSLEALLEFLRTSKIPVSGNFFIYYLNYLFFSKIFASVH